MHVINEVVLGLYFLSHGLVGDQLSLEEYKVEHEEEVADQDEGEETSDTDAEMIDRVEPLPVWKHHDDHRGA